MIIRHWTDHEVAILQRDYGQRPVAEIAVILGRSITACWRKARDCGFYRCLRLDRHAEKILALHAEGLPDNQIAGQLQLPSSSVAAWLRRRGLAAHGKRGGAVMMDRRNQKARQAGWASWSAWMASRRRLKHLLGFPGCAKASEVRICKVLSEKGPLTAHELAVLCGVGAETAKQQLAGCVKHNLVERSGTGGARSPYCFTLKVNQGGRHHAARTRRTN